MAKKKKETAPTNEAPPPVETTVSAKAESRDPFKDGFRTKLIQTKHGPGVLICETPKDCITLVNLTNGNTTQLSREGAGLVGQFLCEWAGERSFVMVSRWEFDPNSLAVAK